MWPVQVGDHGGRERRQACLHPSLNSSPPAASSTDCTHSSHLCRQATCSWESWLNLPTASQMPVGTPDPHTSPMPYPPPPLCFLSLSAVLLGSHLPTPGTQLASLTSPYHLHIQCPNAVSFSSLKFSPIQGIVILSEISQTEKEKYRMTSLIEGILDEMIQMNLLQNRKRLTDLEDELMVAGRMWGRDG